MTACFFSCSHETEKEKREREKIEKERIVKERIKNDSIQLVRIIREIDSTNKRNKDYEAFELFRDGKELESMLLSGTISIETYNALKKIETEREKNQPMIIDTTPTITDEYRKKIKDNLGTYPQ